MRCLCAVDQTEFIMLLYDNEVNSSRHYTLCGCDKLLTETQTAAKDAKVACWEGNDFLENEENPNQADHYYFMNENKYAHLKTTNKQKKKLQATHIVCTLHRLLVH